MAYKRISPQPVAEGGTGVQSNTVYAVLCGGTSSTSPIQSIAGVGTSGQVLTSNGAGALPTFQAGASGTINSLTGNTGGAISPSAGNINVVGDGTTIAIAGSGNTLTASLVGTGAIQTLTGSTSGGAISPSAGNINITAGTGITVDGTAHTLTIAATGGGGGGTIVTTYVASNTWNKNASTKFVTVLGWCGGASGGSGRQGTSSNAGGGAGGAGAPFFQLSSPASFFNSSETVTIGAGGSVTAGQSSASTDGTIGNPGGVTSFGNIVLPAPPGGTAGTGSTAVGVTSPVSLVNYATASAGINSGNGATGNASNATAVTLISSSGCASGGEEDLVLVPRLLVKAVMVALCKMQHLLS